MNEKLWFWYLWKSSTQNHGGCIFASGVFIANTYFIYTFILTLYIEELFIKKKMLLCNKIHDLTK